jgi:Flp pilus assembly protein TadG
MKERSGSRRSGRKQPGNRPPREKRAVMQKLLRLVCEQSGSELVEFAMTALVMIALLVVVIEFALAMYSYHFLSSAAQQGTRFAMVRGDTWGQSCSTSAPPNFTMVYGCTASTTDIQNYVQSLATPGINFSGVTVSSVWPGATPDGSSTGCSIAESQGCLVKVTVSYSFKFMPFENLPALSLSATSEGVILQ